MSWNANTSPPVAIQLNNNVSRIDDYFANWMCCALLQCGARFWFSSVRRCSILSCVGGRAITAIMSSIESFCHSHRLFAHFDCLQHKVNGKNRKRHDELFSWNSRALVAIISSSDGIWFYLCDLMFRLVAVTKSRFMQRQTPFTEWNECTAAHT